MAESATLTMIASAATVTTHHHHRNSSKGKHKSSLYMLLADILYEVCLRLLFFGWLQTKQMSTEWMISHSVDIFKIEFSTKTQRISSTPNTRCLPITYTKNFCIRCARVSMMVVSSDGCGGSYHCRDRS
jgi:hypothetical protein